MSQNADAAVQSNRPRSQTLPWPSTPSYTAPRTSWTKRGARPGSWHGSPRQRWLLLSWCVTSLGSGTITGLEGWRERTTNSSLAGSRVRLEGVAEPRTVPAHRDRRVAPRLRL